jgi:hypothetical protein
MARVSGRRLRCGNAYPLKRKGERRRHHCNNSEPSEKRLPREAQRLGFLGELNIEYLSGGGYGKCLPRCLPRRLFARRQLGNAPVPILATRADGVGGAFFDFFTLDETELRAVSPGQGWHPHDRCRP